MKRVEIKRGLDVLPGCATDDRISSPHVGSVALCGDDYPGIKPALAVKEGDRVRAGNVLFTDRGREGLKFCAPAGGIVRAIHRGAKRRLQAVTIDIEDDSSEYAVDRAPRGDDARDLRALLLNTGLWPALRSRPGS